MGPTNAMAGNFLSSTCACSLSESLKSAQAPRTPRVRDLLRSRHPLCAAELADFRRVIEQSPEIIQDIDQRIGCVTKVLESLKAARKQAESNLVDAKSLLHPIRSLPNEILHEIFTYCVPVWNEYLPSNIDSLDSRFAPWTLARVCHSWREVVISSPLLWTYFQFNTALLNARINKQKCAQKASLYLERSKDLSLSMYILDINGRMVNHPVLPALKRAMSRCSRLLTDASTRSLQALSGTVFSRLTLLAASQADVDTHKVQVDTFDSVSAPKLRLVYSDDRRGETLKYVALPWAQLTGVFQLPLSDDVDLQRLRDIPDISSLRVILLRSSIPRDTVIPFRKLLDLDLTEDADAEPGCIKRLIEALVFDALFHLRLDYHMPRRVIFPDMGKCANMLGKLTIRSSMHGHPDNSQNLLEFLSLLPRVRILALEEHPLDAPFLAGLQCSSATPLLPRLRVLNILKCTTPPNDVSALFDMLESRLSIALDTRASSSVNPDSVQCVPLSTLYVPLWLYSHKDERWREIQESVQRVVLG